MWTWLKPMLLHLRLETQEFPQKPWKTLEQVWAGQKQWRTYERNILLWGSSETSQNLFVPDLKVLTPHTREPHKVRTSVPSFKLIPGFEDLGPFGKSVFRLLYFQVYWLIFCMGFQISANQCPLHMLMFPETPKSE